MGALDELLALVRDTNPGLYARAKQERHVLRYGEHYDEEEARKAVECMSSTDAEGKPQAGEHWTVEQTITAVQPYSSRMGDADTIFDAYVAVNMWWHDLGKNYKRRGDMDDAIIDDALTWSFFDEDAPDGKLWKYLHAL